MPAPPLVSIVIPTFNSGEALGVCLGSIRGQDYENVEIIIVDRGSTDGTEAIARRFSAQLIVRETERAEAKNIGLGVAQGKYLLFVDSDMELTAGVISECVRCFDDPAVGGVTIPERSVGDSFWVRVRDFERSFYAGTAIESARFFSTDIVRLTAGFQPGVVFFEESTLPQRVKALGYSIETRIAAPILHHEDNFSLGKWLRKKYYYGRTAREYRSQFEEYGLVQMSLLQRFRIFLAQPQFYRHPLLAMGVLFLKLLEFGSAGLGYASSLGRSHTTL